MEGLIKWLEVLSSYSFNHRKYVTFMNAKTATSALELPILGNAAGNKPIISDTDKREQRIAWLAYSMAEKRGFEPGHELEDWLEAEKAEAEVV